MCKKNKGISLIVLVITIIIMIILAAAIILSLSNTNIIANAKEAVKSSDEANLKTVANLVYSDYIMEMSKGNDPTNVAPYNGDYNAWAKDRIKAEGVSIDLTDYEFTSDGKYGKKEKEVTVTITGFDENISTYVANWKDGVNIIIKIEGDNVNLSKCKYVFAVSCSEDNPIWETSTAKVIDNKTYVIDGDKLEAALEISEGKSKKLCILIEDKQGNKKLIQGVGRVNYPHSGEN